MSGNTSGRVGGDSTVESGIYILTSVVPYDKDPSSRLLCASTTALTVPVTMASNVSLMKPNAVN